jgi:integrase
MANTGLRPDEAARLEYRDVMVVTDQDSGQRLLEIEVRGKRGIGHCKSMTGAILPFQRMQKRHKGKPTDRIFGKTPRIELNKILEDLKLKHDRDGNVRTAYSLRHTYICFRLMEGADIYQIAKNCRTSVEMIEQFYAAHLKNTLDASAINVRKPKKATPKAPA